MLIKYYILREVFENFIRIVSESTHHDVGLSSCTELLLSINPGCKVMKIQTRFDIKPVQATVTLELTDVCEMGFCQTISYSGLSSVLRYLPQCEFIGLEAINSNIRIFSAIQNSILDEDVELKPIEENSNYCPKSSQPEVLTNYTAEPDCYPESALKIKNKHVEVISNLNQIAYSNHQPANTVFLYLHNELGVFVELQSGEVYAKLQLSEEPLDNEFKTVMDFDGFKALKNVLKTMRKAKMKGVTLYAAEDKMILSQDTINAQLPCIGLDQTFTAPFINESESGWLYEDPEKLVRMLYRLGVSSKKVDDVVKLTISDNKLQGFINTEAMAADRELVISSGGVQTLGQVFDVKRELLIAALKSFPPGHYVRIHGFLTEDTHITIRSTVNDDVVVLAKMKHVTD